MRRLQGERENLQSKLEAEKHVMRAQLRDLMQKHESELRRVTEKHEQEMSEKEQALCGQLQDLQRSPAPPVTVSEASMDSGSAHRLSELAGSLITSASCVVGFVNFVIILAWCNVTPVFFFSYCLFQFFLTLVAQVKLKAEDASKSETKFLKMKAWSKSRIRQLEEELKKAQASHYTQTVSTYPVVCIICCQCRCF